LKTNQTAKQQTNQQSRLHAAVGAATLFVTRSGLIKKRIFMVVCSSAAWSSALAELLGARAERVFPFASNFLESHNGFVVCFRGAVVRLVHGNPERDRAVSRNLFVPHGQLRQFA
jgi:hypothetical protein